MPPPQGVPWRRWGGPQRNFQTQASGLPRHVAGGLRPTRPLEARRWAGLSSVIVEGAALYTICTGKRGEETVLAGQRRHRRDAVAADDTDGSERCGAGDGQRPIRYAASRRQPAVRDAAGRLQCLDRASGKVLWTQQLWDDHGGSRMMYGYTSARSRIGTRSCWRPRGKAVMAFNQPDGKVVWARHDFGNVYSSPIPIDVAGLEQVVGLDGALVGVNPVNGDLQWQVPFKADHSIAVATPLWGPGNLLFVSSESKRGRQGDRAPSAGPADRPEGGVELTVSELHHGNAMR